MINSKQFLKTAGILTFGVAKFQAVVTAVPSGSTAFSLADDTVKK
jgi:hypothetical protein